MASLGGDAHAGEASYARRRRRRGSGVAVLAVLAAAAAVLSGCTSSTPAALDHAAADKVVEKLPALVTESQAQIAVSPVPGPTGLEPSDVLRFAASKGRLTSVSVVADDGHPVDGTLSGDGASWASSVPLPPGTTLRYEAVAKDAGGRSRTVSGELATVKDAKRLTTAISPLSGLTVGVGMPIVVRFNASVTDKAVVESHLKVSTSRDVEGAWSWTSDREVHWRPREYWPAYTDVRLDVRLAGVHAGPGLWGMTNRAVTFSTGASMVSLVDVAAHTMTVRRDGKVIKILPVTTGKDGFLTRNGTKVILEKFEHKIMDSATVGIPKGSKEYYRLDVPYAMRVTWSGEFVHAAPWSESEQGLVNVSHGCVGMSESNGKWFFDESRVGDVVQVVNSPRHLEPGNGYTDWNVSWSQWLAGSATQSRDG